MKTGRTDELIEQRLRQALADTHEREPRPLAKLDLPLGGDRWLTPAFMKSLRRAAVLAPVLRDADGYSMLLTRRAEHLSSHKGQISFPGGGRDATDVSAAANALREAQEEVGLDPALVEVIGYLDEYPTISRYTVTPVVGIVQGPVTLQADPSEVAEVFQVPLEIVLDPHAYQRRSLSREGLIVPFHELNWNGYRIWGATAGMLWDLCNKVNQHGG
ncbi:MAG: CoA pyrophosphatase [Panacagrimonas sp.]